MPKELDPQAEAFLSERDKRTIVPSHALSPTGAREAMEEALASGEPVEAVAEVTDWAIRGPAGQIPIRVYRPDGEGPFPILVYFHAGGWVKGSLETHDDVCRQLTNETGMVVVAVEYRLSPEHPFPTPLEDCYAATEWAAEHGESIHWDPDRLAIIGESAGGNLAAATALLARDRDGPSIEYQVLLYPVLDNDFTRNSYREVGDVPLLTEESLRWYWDQYIAREVDRANPYAAPLRTRDLSGLPPATVVVVGWDPLHDEGVNYAERLSADGVPTDLVDVDDQIHAFLSVPYHMDRADEIRKRLAEQIQENLSQ
jgi:acetyl esterase